MSLTTRTLRLHLLSVLGAPLAGAKVTLQLSAYQADGTDIVPLVWTLPEDPAVPGDYVGPIWPNTRGDSGTHYDMLVQANGESLLTQVVTVSSGAAEAVISAKVNPPPYPQVFAAEKAVSTANTFADAAGESASRAQAAIGASEELAEQLGDIAEAVAATAEAVPAKNAAVAAAASAALSRDASFALGPKYVDEPTGRAASADGAAFLVVGAGDTAALEYRRINAATVSTLIATYPSTRVVSRVKQRAEGVTEIFDAPNQFSDHNYTKLVAAAGGLGDADGTFTKGSGISLAKIETSDGRPGFRMGYTGAGGNSVIWTKTLAQLGVVAGDKMSATLRFLAGSVVSGGIGATRLIIQQLDATTAEIVGARQLYPMPVGAVASDLVVSWAGSIVVAAGAVNVRIYLDTASAGTTLDVCEVMLAKGSVSDYRASPAAYVGSVAATAGANAATAAVAPVQAQQALIRRRTEGTTELFDAPNLFTDHAFTKLIAAASGTGDESGIFFSAPGFARAPITTADGRPAFSLTCTAAGTQTQYWRFPVSGLGVAAGGKFSASLRLLGGTTPGTARVLLRQTTAALAEIPAVRQTYNIGIAATLAESSIAFAGVVLDATAAWVELYIDTNTVGVSLQFCDYLLAAGSVADFRASPKAYVEGRVAAGIAGFGVATKPDIGAALAPLYARPNLVDNNWPLSIAGGTVAGTRESVVVGGIPAVKVTLGSGEWRLTFARSAFPSGMAAVSASMLARSYPGGGRIIVMQINASNVEIAGTRTTLTVPVGTTLPSTVSGIVALDAACTAVWLYISANNAGVAGDTVTWKDVLLANGSETSYRPALASSGAIREAFISQTGNDITGLGTEAAPWLTPDRAQDALNGVGAIVVMGEWLVAPQFDASKVIDLRIIGRTDATKARPLLRYGTKLTGVSKTSGQTKVYEAALPTTGRHNWLWLDNVPDAQSLVPANERHFMLRGRAHRLPCTKLQQTLAATKAPALVELDADALPLSHCETAESKVYVTLPGGADASAGGVSIYAATSTGMFKNVPDVWAAASRLTIMGVDVRYGNINTRGFRETKLVDVFVMGALLNCFDMAWWTEVQFCEAAGGGSGVTVNGDGFNGHDFIRLWGQFYSHDNRDDGASMHERAWERLTNCIAEYNCGSGFTPAYGTNAYYLNPVTRKNAVNPRFSNGGKRGGIEAHQTPSAGADAAYTSCEVDGAYSDGDRYAFSDTTATGGYLKMRNSLALNSVEAGYDCLQALDCRYGGTGIARTGRTTVVTTSALA